MRYLTLLLWAAAFCSAQGYIVDTIAGTGTAGLTGDRGPAIRATLNSPGALILDAAGRLYFADRSNNVVRRIETSGIVSTYFTSDDPVDDIALSSGGVLYLIAGNRLRAISAGGDELQVASPEGGFIAPRAVAAEPSGSLLIGDENRLIRVTSDSVAQLATLPGTVTSIAPATAGTAIVIAGNVLYSVSADGTVTLVAGATATAEGARVTVDRWGNIYVSGDRITKIVAGKEYILTGLSEAGFAGDLGSSLNAKVNRPAGVAVDRGGNVYFADSGNNRIRFLRPNQPGTVVALVPSDGAQEIWPKKIQLRWTTLQVPATWDVFFGTSENNLAKLGTSENGTFDLPNDLNDRTRYFWQVRTQIAPLPPLESPVVSFTTTTSAATLPARPDNPTPLNGSIGQPVSPIMSWTGGGATAYLFLIGESSTALARVGAVGEPRLLLTNLKPETTYYWQVGAVNDTGVTPSAIWSFTTGPANGYPWMMETLAGTSLPIADGLAATETVLSFPRSPVTDSNGNIYFIDGARTIRRLGNDGKLSTTLTLATGSLSAIAADPASRQIWFATPEYVYRIDTRTNTRTYIAGQVGSTGYAGDGGLATQGLFGEIRSIAVDRSGTLYIADGPNNRVRLVSNGRLRTFAGRGDCGETDGNGLATELPLCSPSQVATDQNGNVYVFASGMLLKIGFDGIAQRLAPDTSIGVVSGIAVDRQGIVFAADAAGNVIRSIDPETGTVTVYAATAPNIAGGFAGDGQGADSARFWGISGLGFDLGGNLLVGDSRNYRIRSIDPASRSIRTVAGTSTLRNERGNALNTFLYGPADVAVDGGGNVFVADSLNHRIRRISSSRVIDTVAGGGETVVNGPDVIGRDARDLHLDLVSTSPSLVIDQRGNLVFNTANAGTAQDRSDPIIGISPNSIVGSYLLSTATHIGGIARGRVGELYVSDSANHRILRIEADGTVSIFAGNGSPGTGGDGGQAVVAQLNTPRNIALSPSGDLYVAETGRIRKIEASGRITTAAYENATGLAFDNQGVLYVAAGRSIFISAADRRTPGLLTLIRIAGRENGTVPDKPVSALDARVTDPRGLALTSSGEFVFADYAENAVRRMSRNLPGSLQIVDGDNQTVSDRFVLAKPLQVRVLGRTGVPVPGVSVRYTVTAAGAIVGLQIATTDASGVARFSPYLPQKTAEFRIEASVAGAAAPVVFRAVGSGQSVPSVN